MQKASILTRPLDQDEVLRQEMESADYSPMLMNSPTAKTMSLHNVAATVLRRRGRPLTFNGIATRL